MSTFSEIGAPQNGEISKSWRGVGCSVAGRGSARLPHMPGSESVAGGSVLAARGRFRARCVYIVRYVSPSSTLPRPGGVAGYQRAAPPCANLPPTAWRGGYLPFRPARLDTRPQTPHRRITLRTSHPPAPGRVWPWYGGTALNMSTFSEIGAPRTVTSRNLASVPGQSRKRPKPSSGENPRLSPALEFLVDERHRRREQLRQRVGGIVRHRSPAAHR